MLKWRHKAVAGVCLALLIFTPLTADAQTLQQKLNQYQQQYSQLNQQLSDQNQQAAQSAQRVQALQQSLDALNSGIESHKADITRQQNDLEVLDAQKKELEAERQKDIEALQGFLQANYENGVSNYWLALLSSDSWSELFDRAYELSSIVTYYHNLQQNIAANDSALRLQQTAIRQKTADLQASLQSKQQTQQNLQQLAQAEQNALSQLNHQQKATVAAAYTALDNINYVQEMMREAQLEEQLASRGGQRGGGSSGHVGGPINANASAQALVTYALGYVGVPYVWGGTSPSGWDCSGFVQYVYSHFGVRLPRVSEDQYNVGVPVSPGNLQPGDLVFFQTYNDGSNGASHVGIYIGGGNMVNAESPRYGTRVDAVFANRYWGPRYIGARRILRSN